MTPLSLNIADRLRDAARQWPDRLAVVAPGRGSGTVVIRGKGRPYRTWTFRELEEESDALARGLIAMGVRPGHRLVLFVRFSWEFIALTFAMFKAGAVVVLIDPGMGRANIFECLREVHPDGFIAVPIVQAVRLLKRGRFPDARFNVTVGRRWFWGGPTYAQLIETGRSADRLDVAGHSPAATDAAAIIFTSGSTGPPKGVLYEHGMFDAQVDLIRGFYGIQPGEIDLPGFPLFGLFNAAMGVTTVIPEMDPTRPAQVDPEKILAQARDWQVTQAFGSPAFWNRVGRYCEAHAVTLPAIRRGLSAGGPVPVHVLRRMSCVFTGPGADLHTPYGATESLPVASIGAHEVLQTTAALTAQGRGTCVGRPFPQVDVRIIAITDGPIASLSDARPLPPGEIGEIIVRSPSVTREYFQRPDATRLTKIPVDRPSSAGPDRTQPLSSTGNLTIGFDKHVGETGWGEGAAENAPVAPPHPSPLPHWSVPPHAPSNVGERESRASTRGLEAQSPPSADAAPAGGFYHRIGDVGYLDEAGRLWFCGRKAHIVDTREGRMFSVCCEAILDEHPDVYRTALVGLGPKPNQRPVIVIEPEPGRFPATAADRERFTAELRALATSHPLTAAIETFLFHPSLPVDTRHNVKINREALAIWAAGQI